MANASPVAQPAVLSDLIPGARVRDAALVVGGAALTGLAAQLAFPMWPVPVTGQTFAVVLVGAALGMNRAALSMALYMLVGIAGVPWFAGGASGFGGPTFGYVLGFIAAAALVGRLAERGGDRTVARTVGTMVLGNLTIYAFGLPVLIATLGLGLGEALAAGVIPFLVGDAIKIAVAAGLLPAAWKLARR
ncbi:biotin biosynthesis protein BioY [Planomonospora parontospora subsp. parontospora]|uniref:Biotin transporter n=2 Tax=Planomonospora parontospora TaxID=58119 RepID=A0AA37BGW5_9ACTN|nr:biotin transporter BioY [Planomonospora parontospora]GGK69025.1 biotin biosynthesis protein BioY [Planomonospora parontospora]GII08963.1 biotin biosynthesis protein BioY [Planomonospora parontospora subsp. parontospora]